MKRLLLATDLCANSDRAMERAIRLAKEHNAKLYILHAVSDKHIEPDDMQECATEIEELIKGYIGDYKQSQGLDVAIDIVRSLNPHETICAHAAKVKAEMIVMGMHRKARFMDLFMSTTFSKVLRGSSLPMLMVKEKPIAPYQDVLCGNDFAPGFYKAFDAAVDIAPDAHFLLMHSCEKLLIGSDNCDKEHEKKMLAFIDKQKKRRPLDIDYFFVKSDPYYALIEKSQEANTELICIGTHGNETSKIGPVANSLMADPPCDILVAGVQD